MLCLFGVSMLMLPMHMSSLRLRMYTMQCHCYAIFSFICACWQVIYHSSQNEVLICAFLCSSSRMPQYPACHIVMRLLVSSLMYKYEKCSLAHMKRPTSRARKRG